MANRLQKLPTLQVIAGVAGVQAREAYCVTYQEIVGWKKRPQSDSFGRGSAGGETVNVYVPPQINETGTPITGGYWTTMTTGGGSGGSGGSSGLVPIYKEHKICYPEVIGVTARPTKIVKSINNSWDNGARSVVTLNENQFIDLDIRKSPVAIMLGLGPKIMSYRFDSLVHGVIIRTDSITPVAKGLEGVPITAEVNKLRIARYHDRVIYYADGVKVHEAAIANKGELHVYAQLYSIGDYVENPVIGRAVISAATAYFRIESSIDSTPRGISTFRIQTSAVAMDGNRILTKGVSSFLIKTAAVAHAAVAVKGTSEARIQTSAEKYGGFSITKSSGKIVNQHGGVAYAIGALYSDGHISTQFSLKATGIFPPLKITGYLTKPEPEPVSAQGLFPNPKIYAYALTGYLLSGRGEMSAKGKASEGPFLGGGVNVYLKPEIKGWFDERAKGYISTHEPINAYDMLEIDSSVIFSFIENIGAMDSIDVYLILNFAFNEFLLANDSISFSSLIELIISEKVYITPDTSIAKAEAIQYAVNAITGALSRYSNFGFKQFATSSGRTYAITSNGLYELNGNTDADDKISASIDFGASDFGLANSKRVSSVYAGISTDGGAYIRLSGDKSKSIVYRAISHGDEARAVTAKGISARHWRVQLELIDASYADLDNIEVEIGVSQRRLGASR